MRYLRIFFIIVLGFVVKEVSATTVIGVEVVDPVNCPITLPRLDQVRSYLPDPQFWYGTETSSPYYPDHYKLFLWRGNPLDGPVLTSSIRRAMLLSSLKLYRASEPFLSYDDAGAASLMDYCLNVAEMRGIEKLGVIVPIKKVLPNGLDSSLFVYGLLIFGCFIVVVAFAIYRNIWLKSRNFQE